MHVTSGRSRVRMCRLLSQSITTQDVNKTLGGSGTLSFAFQLFWILSTFMLSPHKSSSSSIVAVCKSSASSRAALGQAREIYRSAIAIAISHLIVKIKKSSPEATLVVYCHTNVAQEFGYHAEQWECVSRINGGSNSRP